MYIYIYILYLIIYNMCKEKNRYINLHTPFMHTSYVPYV